VLAHRELDALAIAHIDCDAFYASVEKRDRPDLRDLPVIVGGGRRGVVTAACYIARLSGVRSAMPMFKALALCAEAVVIAPDFARYRAESRRVFDKLRALSPLVQPLSLDEAWIDLRGTRRLHGATPAATLARLQLEIDRDIGLDVSIGLAPNKFLAKIASDLDKPKGFGVIGMGEARAFLAPRPVSILPGVGPVLAQSLRAAGLLSVGDLARAGPGDLARRFGDQGARLAELSMGRDDRPVDPDQERKSMSAETTFDEDLTGLEELEDRLWPLCQRLARHARAEALVGETVILKLRTADFRIITRQRAAPAPIQTAKTLFTIGRELLRGEIGTLSYRLIGIGLGGLAGESSRARDFFPSDEDRVLMGERAVDILRDRFGDGVVFSAKNLGR
jgi:DNA polymerase-4